MRELYTRLLAGTPRAVALQEAKRQMYSAAPHRPDIWASFVTQGDPEALLRFRQVPVPVEQVYYADSVQVRDLPPDHEFAVFQPDMHILDKGGRPIGVFRDRGLTKASINMRGMPPEQVAGLINYVPNQFDDAWAEDGRGREAFDHGDFREAATHYHRALAALGRARNASRDEETISRLDEIRADTLSRLAMCAGQLDQHTEAQDYGLEAVRLYRQVGLRDLSYAVAVENLGVTLWNLGEEKSAAGLLREALTVKLKVCPTDEEQLTFTRSTLAALTGQTPTPQTRRRRRPWSR
jgi:tetratricopeptide (TPR) repeat protein